MVPKLNVVRLLDCFLSACARTLRSRPDSDERRLVSTDNRRRPLVFLALLTAALVLTAGLVGRPDAKGEPSAPLSVPPDSTEGRSEEHTSELQSHSDLVCRLLLEKKKTSDE